MCLHSDSNCRAAKKIDDENYSTINIGDNEMEKYSKDGYWCCGVRGCNSEELKKAMPKPKDK